MGGVRDAVTHLAMHRTVLTKNYLVPNASRTEAEKCYLKQVFDDSFSVSKELWMACIDSHSEL